MKRNYVAITLGLVLGMASLSGCGSNTSDAESTDTIYGEVSEITDDSITIEVGTMKEREAEESSTEKTENTEESSAEETENTEESSTEETENTEESSAEEAGNTEESSDKEAGNTEKKEMPSMLELTGEEKTITVDDDTTITKQTMGGPGGDAPSGEAPSGEAPSGEAPEKPEGEESSSEEAPEKPEGEESSSEESSSEESSSGESSSEESSSGEAPSGEAPSGEAPSGEAPSGEAPSGEMPTQGEAQEIELSEISEGDIVEITFDEKDNVESITVMSMGGGNGQAEAPDSYEAVTEYTEDTEASEETVESTGTDENAVHVYEGAAVSLSDFTISRSSSESQGGDSSSFYGIGAALLTTDGETYLKDSTIDTDAAGGAGVFSYGDGVTYVADTEINTTQDTSGGIHAAGGGTLYAWDVNVQTKGESSAAIRSDRGGGTMVVDGGEYVSDGVGSPAVYSTADIAVNDSVLTANGSEAVCIEGLNSLRLYDCALTGNMSDDEQNDCTWNVILYQSMSGDSEVGNSTFEMDGGSLTAQNGGMFYTTNTESTITLSDVDMTYADDSEFFLRCTGNQNQRGWGTQGENGADCLFTAINQKMEGNIVWDSISKLDFYITDESTLTGAVIDDESCAGEGGEGYCNIYIEKGSTWTVTEDSTLSSLANAGTIVDESGNTVTIKGTDGTVYVEGDSEYTITVKSYETSVDISGASKLTTWSDYEVERPSEL